MTHKQALKIISIIPVEEEISLSLQEISDAVFLNNETIIEMVEYEMIEPEGESPEDWRFNSDDLKHARIAANLHKDLGINMVGIAILLDLLNQIETLENRIHQLEKFLE